MSVQYQFLMSEFPREVMMWIQSLDLSYKVISPKWDVANGYIVGEIFSRYYPADIQMTGFSNGLSLDTRQHNWHILDKFFKKQKFYIPEEYIDGTIHCKERFTFLLMQTIYTLLTDKKWRNTTQQKFHDDLNDFSYQQKLPLHARSTATKAVKNNLAITELLANKNLLANSQKAQNIIDSHMETRFQKRMENPLRYNVQPTLGQLSVRMHNYPMKGDKKATVSKKIPDKPKDSKVHFKEINVLQPELEDI